MAKSRYEYIADNDAESVLEEKLRLSFEFIDWSADEFFFHGMEESYYQKFFSCLSEIKRAKEKEITQQIHPSLSPKSIFNTETAIKDSFPEEVVSKLQEKLFVQTRDRDEAWSQAEEIASRAFEISLSKNYGRIHGFIWNNTFNIVWFDPAHNLYPMKSNVKKHKDVASVRCFSPDEVKRLQEVIKELQEENAELYEAFAES
jgi:hypothetical protein